MGNRVANELPRCQMERLQKLVEETDHLWRHRPPPLSIDEQCAVASDPASDSDSWQTEDDSLGETELVGFWLDTLCVPVKPPDVRGDQIAKMRHIYADASCVLVLDRFVEAAALSADTTEKFARLYLSNWQRRLWTCQEGVLARCLYFQFSDGQQRLGDLIEEAGLRDDKPLQCTIPALSLDIPAFNEGQMEAFEIGDRFHPILEAVRMRKTAWKKDETICLANLLGLDPRPILGLEADPNQDMCDQRMEKFLSMVGAIPQGLLFHKMERLSTPGFRWAPRTFLGTRLSDQLIPADPGFVTETGETGHVIAQHGLYARFPAYLLVVEAGGISVSMCCAEVT